MAYTYCRSCDDELSAPTTREILEESWCCSGCGCGSEQPIDDDLSRRALVDLLDRIEELEGAMNK